MSELKKIIFLLAGVAVFIPPSISQSVKVTAIEIYGLKRTKESVVRRELTFSEGDTISQNDLGATMEENQNNLLNLGIFNEALVNVSEWNTETDEIEIVIEVKESWYIYLLPILDLADRNFNVWWNTYDHDFNRINIGAQLDFLNFTGYNDKLKAKLQFGYTPKQELEYRFPYFNKNHSLGMTVGILHSINKEVNYESLFNKEQFYKREEHKLQTRWRGQVKLLYRPSIKTRHELATTFEYFKIDSSVLDYNPNYFRNGGISHATVAAKYSFEYDDRDLKIYPSKGIKAVIETEKIGWGKYDDENTFTSTLIMEWNLPLGKRFQYRLSGIGHYSFSRSRPSYIHYHALGYDQKFVRGYELYVGDGLDYAIGKYQLAFKIIESKLKLGELVPVDEFRTMPYEIYLSGFTEAGFVNDPFTAVENPLSNQWMYGGGFGLDFLLYHNFLFQLNMSTNHLGEWGFFIHNKTSF